MDHKRCPFNAGQKCIKVENPIYYDEDKAAYRCDAGDCMYISQNNLFLDMWRRIGPIRSSSGTAKNETTLTESLADIRIQLQNIDISLGVESGNTTINSKLAGINRRLSALMTISNGWSYLIDLLTKMNGWVETIKENNWHD